MPSSSADRTGGHRAPWHRLLLVVLLVAAALTGPAVGYASARFGDTATVTISVTVGSSDPDAPSDPSDPDVPDAPDAPAGPGTQPSADASTSSTGSSTGTVPARP